MKISFTSSFEKDLKRLSKNSLQAAIRQAIESVEAAQYPGEVVGLKKLKTGKDYYRLRIGDYRMGMVIQGDSVKFVRFLHRSEIYRYFP